MNDTTNDAHSKLKVFTNGTDDIVAESLDDVPAVLAHEYGSTMEQEGWTIDEWHEVADDKQITICNIDDRGPDVKETRTAAEWVTLNGRGLLCSTEW